MRRVAVVGIGATRFSAAQEKTEVELFAEAAMDAINEAGLKSEDIQALFLGNVWGDFSEGQGHTAPIMADWVGLVHKPVQTSSLRYP